jgi:hypothetical protein
VTLNWKSGHTIQPLTGDFLRTGKDQIEAEEQVLIGAEERGLSRCHGAAP